MEHKKEKSPAHAFRIGILLGGCTALLFFCIWLAVFRTAFF